jgi:hypothetical protein
MRARQTWAAMCATLSRGLVPIALALALVACSQAGGGQSPTPTVVSPLPATIPPVPALSPLPVASPQPGSSGSAPNADGQSAAVDAAVRDAAGRLSLASGAGDLRVQQVEAREWPDSSLGCPRQGMMYSQVVTPGFLVIVNGAGKELEYHADSRGRIILCSEL